MGLVLGKPSCPGKLKKVRFGLGQSFAVHSSICRLCDDSGCKNGELLSDAIAFLSEFCASRVQSYRSIQQIHTAVVSEKPVKNWCCHCALSNKESMYARTE